MIIYSHFGDALVALDTVKDIVVTARGSYDINNFFNSNSKDILITFNGKKDKIKYPKNIIFSIEEENNFIGYCVENGLNIDFTTETDRAIYEVLFILENWEKVGAGRFNLYNQFRRQYKLAPTILGAHKIEVLKEVLGWR